MGSIDYEQLHGLLWEAISEAETEITAQALEFAKAFTAQLKLDKYVLTEEDKANLRVYITSQYQIVRQAVEAAIRPTIKASGASANMVDALTRQAADVAFQRRWPDGLDLSKRLWTWGNDTEQGIFEQLRKGIKASEGASKLMYDLQFLLEQDKKAFEIVADDFPKWIDDVERWAREATISPEARREWIHRVVPEIEKKASKMAENGTKRAVEQFITEMKKAVDQGRVDLIDRSVKWWVYEKQLYDLKRITRTELSTAQHNAVIDTTQDDADIIGYQWRLSASHPRPDVCDFYAHIDFGLGQGVFPKESVPRRKAHPHCMCLLIPRATTIKKKGESTYTDFLKTAPANVRNEIMPVWMRKAEKAGLDLSLITRPGGFSFMNREQAKPIAAQYGISL